MNQTPNQKGEIMPNPKDDPKIHCPKCGAPRVSFTSGMLFGAHKRHCDGSKQFVDKESTAKTIGNESFRIQLYPLQPESSVRRILVDNKLIEGVVMNGMFYPFQDESR